VLVSCQRATSNFAPLVVGGNPVFLLHDKDLHSWKKIRTILSEYVILSTVLILFFLKDCFSARERSIALLFKTELATAIPAVEESND